MTTRFVETAPGVTVATDTPENEAEPLARHRIEAGVARKRAAREAMGMEASDGRLDKAR